MKIKLSKRPSFFIHSRDSLVQEWKAWGEFMKVEWRWMLILFGGILTLIALTRPFPPKDVYLAVGQKGSSFEMLGQKFIPFFKQEGIELHLINTSGSANSLAQLADDGNQVNAALMVGGVANRGQYKNLQSLGSVGYVPLWLFYRGEPFTGKGAYEYFTKRKVAIGPPESAAQIILKEILAVNGSELQVRKNLLSISADEGVQKLLARQIDGVVIMDAIDAPNVQALLQSPNIHAFNFIFAPAYVKKLPFLSVVTIPRGSLDLRLQKPDSDILMLASTDTLLVEKRMHPAVQLIFLTAAKSISNDINQFFSKPDFFPTYVDHAIELSPVAKHYYEDGPPPFKHLLPVWVLSYADRMWFILIGLLAVIFPLFKLFPRYRSVRSIMLIEDAYQEIREIERLGFNAQSSEELQALINAINNLNKEMGDYWVDPSELNRFYTMKAALNFMRLQLIELQKKMG